MEFARWARPGRPAAGPPTPAVSQPADRLLAQRNRGSQPAAPVAERGQLPPGPRQPLRAVVSEETAKKLNFGMSPDGTPIGPDDFASEGSVSFEVPMPEGAFTLDLQVDAELGRDRDQVFRIMISDREDGAGRGERPPGRCSAI